MSEESELSTAAEELIGENDSGEKFAEARHRRNNFFGDRQGESWLEVNELVRRDDVAELIQDKIEDVREDYESHLRDCTCPEDMKPCKHVFGANAAAEVISFFEEVVEEVEEMRGSE